LAEGPEVGRTRYPARRTFLALVVIAALLAGCASQVTGSAVPVAHPSTPATAGCDPATLPGCLMPAPAGSTQWSQPYAPNGTITVPQFLDRVYYGQSASERQQVTAQLTTQGLQALAHRSWHASNSDDADVVLLRFSADTGAASRTVQMVHAYASDQDYQQVSAPSLTTQGVSVFAYRKLDSRGEVATIGFGAFGPVAMEFFVWSLATVDTGAVTGWMKQEATLLGGRR
jgi:hypothetical protein